MKTAIVQRGQKIFILALFIIIENGPKLAEIRPSSDLAWVSWLYFATKEKNFPFDKFTTDSLQRKTLYCLDFLNISYLRFWGLK